LASLSSLIFETVVETEEDLVAAVLATCETVETRAGVFERVCQNLKHYCSEVRGCHLEQLL
jgi:hypothetical protein